MAPEGGHSFEDLWQDFQCARGLMYMRILTVYKYMQRIFQVFYRLHAQYLRFCKVLKDSMAMFIVASLFKKNNFLRMEFSHHIYGGGGGQSACFQEYATHVPEPSNVSQDQDCEPMQEFTQGGRMKNSPTPLCSPCLINLAPPLPFDPNGYTQGFIQAYATRLEARIFERFFF